MPVMQPKIYGRYPPFPGVSYFSCSQPNKIMEALTPKIEIIAVISATPVTCAIKTIITDELIEYSTHLK